MARSRHYAISQRYRQRLSAFAKIAAMNRKLDRMLDVKPVMPCNFSNCDSMYEATVEALVAVPEFLDTAVGAHDTDYGGSDNDRGQPLLLLVVAQARDPSTLTTLPLDVQVVNTDDETTVQAFVTLAPQVDDVPVLDVVTAGTDEAAALDGGSGATTSVVEDVKDDKQEDDDYNDDKGQQRRLSLYDLRKSSPAREVIMSTTTNSISQNPMEPMNFTAANGDCNCYSYASRKLDTAKCVHIVHESAVMDLQLYYLFNQFVQVLSVQVCKLKFFQLSMANPDNKQKMQPKDTPLPEVDPKPPDEMLAIRLHALVSFSNLEDKVVLQEGAMI